MPTSLVNPFISWLQAQLDQVAQTYWFQSIRIARDDMTLVLRKR
jgi:hypothetical protein